MAFSHGTAARVWLDGYGASCSLNEVSIEADIDTAETTVLCDTAKTYIPGLEDGTFEASGFFTSDPDAPDETFEAWLDARKRVIFPTAFHPEGADAVGDPGYMLNGMLSSYSVETTVEDAATIELEIQTSNGIERGLMLHPHATETADDVSTELDNGADSANGASALLSVSSISGTTPELDVIVQHSDDNAVWVPLMTFSTVDTTSSEYLTATGAVERYVRVSWTLTGTDDPEATFNVIFRRR